MTKCAYMTLTLNVSTVQFSLRGLTKSIILGYIFHKYLRFTGEQRKREAISLYPLCDFHLLKRHLDINWVIAGEISRLCKAGSRTLTENLWFPNASS